MRRSALAALLANVLLMANLAYPQSTNKRTTSDPQAVALANTAYLALTNGLAVNSMVLSGSAQWMAGSANESGTVTLEFSGITESRMNLVLPTQSRTLIRNDSSGVPAGEWAGADGALHPMAPHNCWIVAAWFSPSAVTAVMLQPDAVLTYVGSEKRNGVQVDHIHIFRNASLEAPLDQGLSQPLSSAEVYLDSNTHLPLAYAFNSHPPNDAIRNIPAEIEFSDYQAVSGVVVPFRMQSLIEGNVNLDITLSAVNVNAAISDSDFALN